MKIIISGAPQTARIVTVAALLTLGVAAPALVPCAGAKDAPARVFDAKLDAPLISAVNAGNAREVGKLLKRGANPNAREANSTGTTALGVAAPAGNMEIVALLVEAGANLEDGNALNQTPMLLAVLHSRTEVIAYLVERGAQVDSTQYGFTALMLASLYGDNNSVRALLRAGAGVNVRDARNSNTALTYAASNVLGKANLETVTLLVAAGADLFALNPNGKDALALAKESKLGDIANYLASKQNLDINLYNAGADAFHANNDSSKAWNEARQLLDDGAKGYYKNQSDETALILFSLDAKGFDETIAKRLITVSDVNAQTKKGQSPLHAAAGYGNEKMVALLVESGAKLSLADEKGETSLDKAQKYPAIAAMLRKAGAQPGKNTVAATPDTPPATVMSPTFAAQDKALFDAIYKNYNQGISTQFTDADWEPVEKLLGEGASGRYVGSGGYVNGYTALMMATRNYKGRTLSDAALQTLLARSDVNATNAEGESALHFAVLFENRKLIELLVAAGADLELRSKKGKTPREGAYGAEYTQYMNGLINKAAPQTVPATSAPANVQPANAQPAANNISLDEVDGEGYTALMRAAMGGKADEIARLLQAGAKVDFANAWGGTALFSATWASSPASIKVLLDAGADINHQRDNGESILEAYVDVTTLPTVQVLIEGGIDRKFVAPAIPKARNKEIVDYLKNLPPATPKPKSAVAKPSAPVAPSAATAPKFKDAAAATVGLFDALQSYEWDEAAAEGAARAGGDLLSDKKYGLTPLMFASANGTLESVRWLLSKKVPINATDVDGKTALMLAAGRTDAELSNEIVIELLDGGAKPQLKDKTGKTALDLAKAQGNTNAALMLDLALDLNL